ncbi:5-oxoprolinase subunit PxpA [Echinicola sp. CAU 1574]|uniref:5-oxoprolinase subunit PxpA n=1 Tax=Echinicola arenosa TaxID=2774144 RepID=A0ABR9APM4_9BACT|nr:5-oxoprolinase subunit PxpA [Echinicola arenosa]MBD8490524.1 5-oxoprolinase subunit PxpA [Echinicola arenosa]
MPIDINSDLGEGMGSDAAIMPYITSCNIACGGHAGDDLTMQKTIELAIKNKLKIGAHPSYPDPENFGRLSMDITLEQLKDSILTQIETLEKWVSLKGAQLHHIKPHGALYNEAAINPTIAKMLVQILKLHYPQTILYAQDGSIIAALAEDQSIKVEYEVFADRNYNDDLTLVNRKKPKAVLHRPEEVLPHLSSMIEEGKVKTLSGKFLRIKADTICVHGDNSTALEIAKAIYTLINK